MAKEAPFELESIVLTFWGSWQSLVIFGNEFFAEIAADFSRAPYDR